MADLTPEELANIEHLAHEKNREKQLRRMRALARAAEVGAYISGQHDLAEGLGAAAEGAHAYGEGAGQRAGGMRKAGGNLAGSQAAKFAKRRGTSGGKAAGIGGAVAGAIQGGSAKDIAKSAASWYLLWLAFGALFTLVGSIPALIYLNFHFVMSKLGSKLFGEMTFLQKLGLLAADFIAIFLILIVIVVPIAVIAGMCDSSSDIGGSTLGILVRGSSALGAYGLGPFGDYCTAFSGIASVVDSGIAAMCSTPQIIAQQNGTAYPYNQDSQDLIALMSCIESKPGMRDARGNPLWGSRFTFEERDPGEPVNQTFCNYTRGRPILSCGVNDCAHSISSCHYGGRNGSLGAEAVDYGNEAIAAELIQAAAACGAGFWLNEGDHVHISTRACGSDGGDR